MSTPTEPGWYWWQNAPDAPWVPFKLRWDWEYAEDRKLVPMRAEIQVPGFHWVWLALSTTAATMASYGTWGDRIEEPSDGA